MKVLFRVDGSVEIGTGHVMRCLALAQGFRDVGIEGIFVMKRYEERLSEKVPQNNGFKVESINSDFDLKKDFQATSKTLKQLGVNFVITDSYAIDTQYLTALKKLGLNVLSIDDLADQFFPSDIILNQNINASKDLYRNKVNGYSKLLLGPPYALLRKEFSQIEPKERSLVKIRNVLITMGGADYRNQTVKALRAIRIISRVFQNLHLKVVIGPGYQHELELADLFLWPLGYTLEVLRDAENMAKLLDKVDFVISAAGSTCWELCYMGIPGVVMAIAENQRPIAEELGRRGIFTNLGWYENVTENDIAQAVIDLISNPVKRRGMSKKGEDLVDGKGVQRVAEEVLKYAEN